MGGPGRLRSYVCSLSEAAVQHTPQAPIPQCTQSTTLPGSFSSSPRTGRSSDSCPQPGWDEHWGQLRAGGACVCCRAWLSSCRHCPSRILRWATLKTPPVPTHTPCRQGMERARQPRSLIESSASMPCSRGSRRLHAISAGAAEHKAPGWAPSPKGSHSTAKAPDSQPHLGIHRPKFLRPCNPALQAWAGRQAGLARA